MRVLANLVVLGSLAVSVSAQSAFPMAQLKNLVAVKEKGGVRVEVDLTSPVTPRVTLASGPNRLVLEFPNTAPNAKQTPLRINKHGVTSVHVEADLSVSPMVTRVIVTLDRPLPYTLATEGSRTILRISRALDARSGKRTGEPVAAASAPILGRGRRKADPPLSDASNTIASTPIVPPPALPSISFPDQQSNAAAGRAVASSEAAAAKQAAEVQTPLPRPPATGTEAQAEVQTEVQTMTSADRSAQDQAAAPLQANPDVRMAFRVKYVAEGVAYLDGGRNDGLAEGMKLVVKEIDPSTRPTAGKSEDVQPVADLEVASAALSSAVGEIHNPTRPVKVGDWAYLSSEETQSLIAQRSLSATRKYPVVIAFSQGDTLDDEARVEVPKPPLPEINRARGSIGFDYSGVASHGTGGGLSSNAGMMIRTDITRINGTYWNLTGFWRGRLNQRSYSGRQTLQDLINRTYTIGLTYDNPHSNWVAGFGRLYLPWATSLDSIDGGYFGRRLSQGITTGIFAGTSPDPTSWSYNPDLRIGGAFVNFEGGSFDDLRYTSTSGMGVSLLKWQINRPFVFFENGIFYKRYVSIYHALQADSPSGNAAVAAPGPGVSRSFFTLRLQPASRLEFDINHTYFRDIPTYNLQLIGTGLLDKYLFQGFSGGVRVQVLRDLSVYTTLGRSSRSGDAKASWNQLYGVTLARVPWIGVRGDLHYTKFSSSFGNGSYASISFSRNFRDAMRWELLGGRQSFVSPTTNDTSHFVTGNLEAGVGQHYFVQTGYTWNRGVGQNYDQWMFTFGYRFDSRSNRR